jgi:hypothetical protein
MNGFPVLALLVALALSEAATREKTAPVRGRADSVGTVAAFSESRTVHSQERDDDRGCCSWEAARTKCTYTNRKYCSARAEELGVTYRFFKDTKCAEVPACQ